MGESCCHTRVTLLVMPFQLIGRLGDGSVVKGCSEEGMEGPCRYCVSGLGWFKSK